MKRTQLEREENLMKLMVSQQQQKQIQEFQAMMSMQAKQQSDFMMALVTKLIGKH